MNFFQRLKRPKKLSHPLDLSPLKTDMHSHLIPGIDDGVQTVDEAMDMLRGLYDLGFRKVVTTPHIMGDMYKNTPETILGGLAKVQKAATDAGIPIEIEAAAEYLLDDAFSQKLENNQLLPLGERYLLVELSYLSEPINLNHMLFDIQTAGYRVILAHAERYPFWHNQPERYREMRTRSIHLQLNLLSISGYHGKLAKKTALWLLENNMYSFAGTDLHNQHSLDALKELQYCPHLKTVLDNSSKLLNSQL